MKLRGLHVAWALVGLASSAFLVFAGGGHPAPIIFLPVVVAVWVGGHLALAGAGWLARRGATVAAGAAAGDVVAWSLPTRVAVVACGLGGLVGLIQLIVTALRREPYPFSGALWWITLVIWGLHGACLAGLLLRRSWSRPFAALLSFGWSALMAWQIVDHLWRGRPLDPLDFAISLVIVAVAAGFGALLLRSPASASLPRTLLSRR